MNPLVKLAKETVEHYAYTGKILSPPADLTAEMRGKAGVFVSIKKKGALRGCIGTLAPTAENIACEVTQNAVSASTQDPRFPPVDPAELADLEYSVDVLTEPERVADRRDLNPEKYGVIVKSGDRKGLLLPDLAGVDTVDDQIRIASMKAGISDAEDIDLYRFEVKRYR